MIGASKILTVSYGTFSCTLEGFDDPFNTMRAIAEYFRDLAAGDRYFGAEPPQPDAAMLHRIAEREIHRRVEARVDETGVTLRAADEVAPAPVVKAAVAAVPVAATVAGHSEAAVQAEEVAAPETVLPEARPDVAVAPTPKVENAPEPEADAYDEISSPDADFSEPVVEAVADALLIESEAAPVVEPHQAAAEIVAEEDEYAPEPAPAPKLVAVMPEGVAAKLARLRQSVAASTAAPVAAAPAFDAGFEDEPAVLTDLVPGNEGALFAQSPVEDTAAELPVETEAKAISTEAERAGTIEAEAEAEAEVVESFAPAAEVPPADAALSQDDDVLGRLDSLLKAEEPAQAEPAPAPQAVADLPDDDLDGLIAKLTGTAPAATEVSAVDPFAQDPDFEDDIDSYELSAEAEPTALPDNLELGDLNDDLPEELAALVTEEEIRTPELEAELRTELAAEPLHEAVVPQAETVAEPVAALPSEEPVPLANTVSLSPEPAPAVGEKLQRARARVIKIRRADAQPAAPAAASEPIDPKAELHAPAPVARVVPGRPTRSAEGDVDRLLKQADNEMADPESQRRLASIQHLKAAVAATVAERLAGVPQPDAGLREDPYRADLARAVRPIRTREEGEHRPAPLVLVSEQRIDRPSVAPTVTPVRPRRVTAAALPMTLDDEDEFDQSLRAALNADEEPAPRHLSPVAASLPEDEDLAEEDTDNIFASSGDFAEFAELLGAGDLSSMLEAAAAYSICVEKREHFTRPLLMRRVQEGELTEAFTREDGLRSFGMLLREGRILKVRRGHFALSETSPVLAEARRIAG